LPRCALEPASRSVSHHEATLSPTERIQRASLIKETAARQGLTNGLLLAGVADAETHMSHCWSELTWACMGPVSADCDGGPVVAGAGDGPCEDMQGGLGMFQFDAGTYDETLAREGERVLTLEGNVEAAIDFVIDMVVRSEFIPEAGTPDEALAFMNDVRPWNELYPAWIQTVTALYNGCHPDRCSIYEERFARYERFTTALVDEMGESFWYGTPPEPPPEGSDPCVRVPSGGRVIEEDDACFELQGAVEAVQHEVAGSGGASLWVPTRPEEADVTGRYSLRIASAGEYLVEAYTDRAVAQSRQATYRIRHSGEVERVTIDQALRTGFVELGTFDFEASDGSGSPTQWVELGNATGEDGLRLGYDAIRLVPPDDGSPEPEPEPEMPGEMMAPGGSGGCAVRAAASERPKAALVVLALLSTLAVRRRNR
jgi:hypothetical protein